MIQLRLTRPSSQYIAENSILKKTQINKLATSDVRVKVTLMPQLQSNTFTDTGDNAQVSMLVGKTI